jgi:hypothetical protein
MTEHLEPSDPNVTVRVVAEIRTNAIDAEAKQLDIVEYLGGIGGVSAHVTIEWNPKPELKKDSPELRTTVDELLTTHVPAGHHRTLTRNSLEREKIVTVRDLLLRSKDDFLDIRRFGEMSHRMVKDSVAKHLGRDDLMQDVPTAEVYARCGVSMDAIPVLALNLYWLLWSDLKMSEVLDADEDYLIDELQRKLSWLEREDIGSFRQYAQMLKEAATTFQEQYDDISSLLYTPKSI